ncbi:MAG: hypothetical protein AAB556_01830 [Patescibacteria group bacterium]
MNGLLPENYEKAFRAEKIFRLSLGAILYASLIFLFGIALLAPSYFALKLSLNDTLRQLDTQELSVQRRNAENLEREIISLNSMLRDYNRNEFRKFSFSNLLAVFLNSSTSGIKINGFDFDKNQNGLFFIRVSGEAALRSDILAYARALKNLKELSEIRSPIANLLKDSNAPFIIEADIKKEFYEQK